MKLRKLEQKDANLMHEWMQDESVVHYLGANFMSMKIEDCQRFIESSQDASKNMHLAIVDENDEYMGTTSLKHIDREDGSAEFAITVRKSAMGHGYSAYGMAEILKLGIEKLGLKNIYWCVSKKNERAVRFYDKNQYMRVTDVPRSITERYTEEQNKDFIWYVYS